MRDGGEGPGARASVPRRKVGTSAAVNMGRRDGAVFTGGDGYLITGYLHLNTHAALLKIYTQENSRYGTHARLESP